MISFLFSIIIRCFAFVVQEKFCFYRTSRHIGIRHISAVNRCIPIISHHEIHSIRDVVESVSFGQAIIRQIRFRKTGIVDKDTTSPDLQIFTWHSHDPFDILCLTASENDQVPSLRLSFFISQTIAKDKAFLHGRLHGSLFYAAEKKDFSK